MAIHAIENVAEDFYTGGDVEVQLAVHVAQGKAHSPSSCLYHLRQTVLALTDLELLAKKFFIKVKFSEYTQDDKTLVIFALLDWLMSGDDVAPLVKDFVNAFVLRHGLKLDQILEAYVTESLAASDATWWVHEEAPWEDKLYAVVNVISDVQVKVQCIVECARMAPVPWSKLSRDMCAFGMTCTTPFVKDLQEQERLAKLKIVLRRHNLHLIQYQNEKNAQLILRSILSHEGESIMEDALTVVSALTSVTPSDAFYFRVLHLVGTERFDEAKTLLSSLERSQKNFVCRRIVTYVTQQLEFRPLNKKCKESLKILTSGILALQNILEENIQPQPLKHHNILSKVQRLNALQVKYNLFPTLEEFENPESCISILKSFIVELYAQSRQKASTKPNLNRTSIIANSVISQTLNANSVVSQSVMRGSKYFESSSSSGSIPQDGDEGGEHSLWGHLDKVEHLASLVGVSRQKLLALLATLANQQGQYDAALQATRQLTATNNRNTSCVNDVIFQLLKMTVTQCRDKGRTTTVAPSKSNSPKHCKEFIEVIRHIISSAIVNCHPCDIPMLNEFGHWCDTSKRLYDECHFKGIYSNDSGDSIDPYDSWKFSPVFADSSMPIEEPIVSRTVACILNAFLLFCSSKTGENPCKSGENPTESVENPMMRTSIDYDRVFFEHEIAAKAFVELTQHLQDRNQDLLHLVISQYTTTNANLIPRCGSDGIFRQSLTPDQISILLMKVINSKQRDFPFACSLLTNLKPKEALKVLTVIIKRLGYDYSKLIMVAEIGKDFCDLNKLKDIRSQFNVLFKRASWGLRLEGFGISFKGGFSGDTKALNGILKEITSHADCTFSILNDFCTDFNWGLTEALECYLSACIRQWKPSLALDEKFGPCSNSKDATTLITRKLEAIVEKMKPDEAMRVIEDEFNAMSSYNYEMLDILLTFLISFERDDLGDIVRGKNILQFLMVYTRQEKPGEIETDEWLSTNPDTMVLPPIAKYRLPFHILYSKTKAKNKLVEKELNSNTVDKWICIASDLKLPSDQIYYLATQNIVGQALQKEDQGQKKWQVYSTNGNLLSHLQSLISKIRHPELLTGCANWVVNRMPLGADKVEAAKMCAQLAKNYYIGVALGHDDGSTVYRKFESRYQQLAIENTLHKYDLALPEYLTLMKDPITLVFKLYEHTSLASLATLNAKHQIDINGCVTQICQIMKFNQNSILLEMLSKWLPSSAPPSGEEVDETVSNFKLLLDSKTTTEDTDSLSDASLSRIIYILRCYPQEQSVSYLINQAMSTCDSVGSGVKLKSLRCLLAIADQETIEKQTVMSIEEIRNLLQTLTYVNRLEAFGHAISPANFASMDKNAMVEGIWRAQRQNPDAILLLADICHDFKIPTASLWEALLGQLTKFVDIGHIDVTALEKVLVRIRNVPHLWLLPQVVAAWTVVVYSPFKKAQPSITKERLEECVHSTNLLVQSCPVDIRVEPLLAFCNSLKLPIIALAIASKTQTRESEIQSILKGYSSKELNAQYNEVKDLLALPQNVEDILSDLE